ncbi:MAG TPA: nitroreductase family protein [Chloroflexota bacterium]|nr:nitroreductase family protein [Chloroflexota bacterium]
MGSEGNAGIPQSPTVEAIALPRNLEFRKLVRERRSVRAYRPEPVPRALIEQVIEAAGWAPSPHGRQPWRFVVLTQHKSKRQLADSMGAEWVRQLSLDGDPPDVVAKRLARSHDRVLKAPVCIIVCLYLDDLDVYPDADRRAAEETMAVQSLGAAAQNLLLAAYDLGLDAGWLCAPLFCQETVRQALSLPPILHPHALLTLGYAAQEPRRRPHLPLDSLIYRFD